MSYPERCKTCGAFLAYEDLSTESGFDFGFYCNNPRCKSNKAVEISDEEMREICDEQRKSDIEIDKCHPDELRAYE